jgi:hypothetical protein
MLVNSRGARFAALAWAAEANLRRRPASAMALTVLRLVFVGVTAALFFAWLTSANTIGRGSSPDADCVSFGRGGARCLGHSAGECGANGAFEARSDCISAGRGGLICDRSVAK